MAHQPGITNAPSLLLIAVTVLLLTSSPAGAHCDGVDGPVVADARIALEKGDATPVLKWVPRRDEQEVWDAFKRALAVRKHGGAARELADRYFFETLVRLHRAHEGAPFTGLKPGGTEVSPAILKADAALKAGNVDELAKAVAQAVEAGIRRQFAATQKAMERKDESVELGRKYVGEYVLFVHYVKHLHEAAAGGQEYGHGSEH
jgi:hypothetical protein